VDEGGGGDWDVSVSLDQALGWNRSQGRKLGAEAREQSGHNGRVWRQSIGRVLSLLAGPYGYTVSLWAVGAAMGARDGPPGLGDISAFALGAVAAFLLLALWCRPVVGAEIPERVSSVLLVNALPLPAIAAGLLASLVPWRPLAIPAMSFATTVTYVVGAAVLDRWGRRSPADPARSATGLLPPRGRSQ
jgi:hypothetical protein